MNSNIKAIVSNSDTALQGDYLDLQTAIDYVNSLGGGNIFVRNGTYTLTADITLYSNIGLLAETEGGVILVFIGQTGITASGSLIYAAGTVAVTHGSKTVTGTSTAWLANLTLGHRIALNNALYQIASIDSDTQITLSVPYFNATASGLSYTSAIYASGITIENFILTNGAANGITLDHCLGASVQNCIVSGFGNDGYHITNLASFNIVNISATGNTGYGFYMTNSFGFAIDALDIESNTSDGIYLSSVFSGAINVGDSVNNGGNGATITNCQKFDFLDMECSFNTGHGVLINGNSQINMSGGGCQLNGIDGVRVDGTASRCVIHDTNCWSNTGYGLRINNASCVSNIIALNQLYSNSGVNYSDIGTTTSATGNVTA